MINLVLVGAGKIAEDFHIPAWKRISKTNLIGIVDKDIKKARSLAKKFKIKNFNTSLSKIIKTVPADAVDICSSNKSHEKLILEALKNNLHVICEKPFVENYKKIRKIRKIANRKKLVCVPAQHQTFRMPSIILKRLILKKKIGAIYSLKISSLYKKSHALKNPSYINSKKFGGPLLDLGSHFIYLVLWLLENPKIKFLQCSNSNLIAKKLYNKKFKVEDYSCGQILFKNKINLNFEFSYLMNMRRKTFEKITIYGTKKNITWPDLFASTLSLNKSFSYNKREIVRASDAMFGNFIKKIKTGERNKELDLIYNSIKIINFLQQSAKSKKGISF